MAYNMTNVTDSSNNILDIIVNLNQLAPTTPDTLAINGLFSILILVSLFLISFAVFQKYRFEVSWVLSSFIVTFASIMFWVVDLLAFKYLVVVAMLSFGSIIMYAFKKD